MAKLTTKQKYDISYYAYAIWMVIVGLFTFALFVLVLTGKRE